MRPFLLAAVVPVCAFAQSLTLEPMARAPFQEPILSFASNSGTIVATGNGGAISVRAGNATWSRIETNSRADFSTSIWTGTAFVVAGADGTIFSSPDGTSWTQKTSGTKLSLWSACFGNGTIVIGADAGKILHSADGNTWAISSTPVSERISGVAFGNNLFVAVTESGKILTSPDALTWTQQQSPASGALSGIAFGANLFVAVGADGEILVSADGTSWEVRRSGTPERLLAISSTAAGFFACGSGGTIVHSSDASSWEQTTLAGSPLLVALGHLGGFYVSGSAGELWESADGSAWTRADEGSPRDLAGAVAGWGKFVAVGANGTILTSPDGSAWAQVSSPTQENLCGIACGGSGAAKFVAVGTNGTILASPDAASWLAASAGVGTSLAAVCYGPPGFVAVGQRGAVAFSEDGVSWTTGQVPGAKGDLLGVAYGNGKYVAVGQWGQIATSPDAQTWTLLPDDPSTKERWYDIEGIAYGNGTFVAASHYFTTFFSADGTTWTKRSAAMVPGYDFHGCVFLGGTFAAFGDAGEIQTSSDGTSWASAPRIAGSSLRGAAYTEGRAIFVGDGGVILATARGIATHPQDASTELGTPGTLSVVAAGPGPFTFQWYRGESGDTTNPLSGETSSSLTIYPGPDGAAYWVRVSDPLGSFDSRAAAITVMAGWTAFHAGWAATGDAANTTTGAGNNTLTPLKNSSTGSPAGNSTIKYSYLGTYNIRTDNKTGWAAGTDASTAFLGHIGLGSQADNVSGNITISLGGLDPSKTYDLTVYAGRDSSTFAATNLNVYDLQGTNSISASHSAGVTSNSSNTASVPVGLGCRAAGRVVRWKFRPLGTEVTLNTTRGGGAVNSVVPQALRLIEISEKPVVTASPSASSLPAGNGTTLSAKIAGAGLTYQWYRREIDGSTAAIPGATGASLELSPPLESAEYYVVATGTGGSVTSERAALVATKDFLAWASGENLSPPGENDDSDGDGIPNLVEFALGMDPHTASAGPEFRVATTGDLVLAFSISREARGVTVRAETCADLAAASWSTSGVQSQKTASPSIIEDQWEAGVAPGGNRTFLRLRVSQP